MMRNPPFLIMLAGSNGAGKSTFYKAYLSKLQVPFLNADELAATYKIDSYLAAKRVAGIRMELVRQKKSFITETVLSDPVGEKVEFLKTTEKTGFEVELIFIGIPSSEFSAQRVSSIKGGGHDVPSEKIKQRYARTLANLDRAIKTGLHVKIYDNSSFKNPYRFIAEFNEGQLIRKSQSPIPQWAQTILP